jgi:hypothetical protein
MRMNSWISWTRRTAATLFLVLIACFIAGCRSPYITATITNQSGGPLSLIEVDYPSASFGVGSLAPGAQYHYRFKILGSGPVKIQFTDASGKEHAFSGPALRERQEGNLAITVEKNAEVSWGLKLTASK